MSTTAATTSTTVVSLGCRLNAVEAEVMRRRADAAGVSPLVIVNTCAVTAEAERQARQSIRRARRERPDARLLVTGCAVEIDPERYAGLSEVDYVVSNREKLAHGLFERLGDRPRTVPSETIAAPTHASAAGANLPSRGRALLAVQSGCDHRCTFCVIPYGRGPARSVPISETLAQVDALVEEGAREIVLTGVDLTSWGCDLPGPMRLGDLVRAILRASPGLERLRISSIDQAEIDDQLLAAFAEEPRLMPHVHLSLQHGSDLILKRMKRRHTRRQAVEACNALRRIRPDIVFGADLIAGFPTETEAHFADTLSIIDDCGISQVHAFSYSPRAGTPAARMPQLPEAAIKDRTTKLVEKSRSVLGGWLQSHVGAEVTAFLEGSGPRDGRARTAQFAAVGISNLPSGHRPGDRVHARVTSHTGHRLLAEVTR